MDFHNILMMASEQQGLNSVPVSSGVAGTGGGCGEREAGARWRLQPLARWRLRPLGRRPLPARTLGNRGGRFLAARGRAGSCGESRVSFGPRPPPGNPPEGAGLRAWPALPEPAGPGPGLSPRRLGVLAFGGRRGVCVQGGRAGLLLSTGLGVELGQGLCFRVAGNAEIPRAKTVVQEKAVAVVKSRKSPFVCSENRSCHVSNAGQKQRMTSFG